MVDNWMDKVKSVASKAVDGAKDLAASTKIKVEISGLQGKIKDAKQEFGLNVYSMLEQGKALEEITAAFSSVQSAIKDFEAQIAAKQEDLKKISEDNA